MALGRHKRVVIVGGCTCWVAPVGTPYPEHIGDYVPEPWDCGIRLNVPDAPPPPEAGHSPGE